MKRKLPIRRVENLETIPQILKEAARIYPSKPFIIFGQKKFLLKN